MKPAYLKPYALNGAEGVAVELSDAPGITWFATYGEAYAYVQSLNRFSVEPHRIVSREEE
jgi:hypothetical protein